MTVQGQHLLEGMCNKLLVLVDQSYLGKGSLHQCLDSYFFINKKMNVLQKFSYIIQLIVGTLTLNARHLELCILPPPVKRLNKRIAF